MAPLAEELSSPADTEASACTEEEPWDKDAEIARLNHDIAAYQKTESRMNEAMRCLRERAVEDDLRVAELETALAKERRLRLALEGAASAQEPLVGALAGEAGQPEGAGRVDSGADLEAQIQELQLLLADREALLAATRTQLAEREGRLTATEELLKLLAESEARIVETEALLVKRDERIAEAEAQLRTLRGLKAEQAARIAETEALLVKRDERIAEAGAQLSTLRGLMAERATRIAELEQRAAGSGSAKPATSFRRLGSSAAVAPAGTRPEAAAAAAAVAGRAPSPPLVRTEFVAAAIAEAFKPQPPSPMVYSNPSSVRLDASQIGHPASVAAVAAALRSWPPSPLARPEGPAVAQSAAVAAELHSRLPSPLARPEGPTVAQALPPWELAPAEGPGARAASPLPPHRVRSIASVWRAADGGAQEMRATSPVPSGRGSQTLPPGPGLFAAPRELRAVSPMPGGRGSHTLPTGPVLGRAASPLPRHALDTSAGSLQEFAPPLSAVRSLPSLPPQDLSPLRAASSPMVRRQQSLGPPADGIPPPWAARVSWA